MLNLAALLAAVKPFGAIGIVLTDLNDQTTWTVDGVSETNRPAALAALQAVLTAVPPVDSVVTLQQQVKDLQTNVKAVASAVKIVLPVPIAATVIS